MTFNSRLSTLTPTARSHRYPLTTEKLLSDTWTPMARFQEPKRVDMTARLQRHAEALGGRVRLLRGDLMLVTWSDGKLVADWREAS
jgi:hypothetical protein